MPRTIRRLPNRVLLPPALPLVVLDDAARAGAPGADRPGRDTDPPA